MPRHGHLIAKRNQKILERFQELYHQQGLRLDQCLEKLEQEFWLSRRTIYDIISAYRGREENE